MYVCKENNNCSLRKIEGSKKRKCRACRMKKCVELGMLKFMEQTKVIKETTSLLATGTEPSTISINDLTSMKNENGPFLRPKTPPIVQTANQSKLQQKTTNSISPQNIPPAHPNILNGNLTLADTPEFHKNLEIDPTILKKIEVLGKLYQTFEFATTEDLATVTAWTHDQSVSAKDERCKHFGELSVVTFKLQTLFYMELPEIELLSQSVQEQIIKKSILPSFFIRSGSCFNRSDQTIIFINGFRYGQQSFFEVGYSYAYTKCLFSFAASLQRCLQHGQVGEVNRELLAIVMALILFNPDHVEKIPKLKNKTPGSQNKPQPQKTSTKKFSFVKEETPDILKNNNNNSSEEDDFIAARDKIFEIQQHYLLLLQVYCKARAANHPMLYVRLLTKLSEIPDLIMKAADELAGTSTDALLDSPFFSETIRLMVSRTKEVKKNHELPVTDRSLIDLSAPLINE